MRTFKAGDRVWHKLHPKNAGTVTKTGLEGGATDYAHIQWDKGTFLYKVFGVLGSTHPFGNLVLIEPTTLKYDPMQQGDTDEDI